MFHKLLHILLLTIVSFPATLAGDPNVLSRFLIPSQLNSTSLNPTIFTFSGFRLLINPDVSENFTVVKASMTHEFPALNCQSVSYAVLLLLLIRKLNVRFGYTSGKLYTQRLEAGDMFVFTKGLVHYQHSSPEGPAYAVSAFESAAAGTVSVPRTVLSSGIDEVVVLAKFFKTDVAIVEKIKDGLAA
ncbi:putative rmlC-like cupin domain superfamily, rmlC-like jelly roll protein [Dioscorea sansibarensis]